jgi:anti-repressor protein
MKNNLVELEFDNTNVRMLRDKENEPWFCAKDVCKAIELVDHSQACSELKKDDKYKVPIPDRYGRSQSTLFINEAGLYELILKSRKPEAKKFKHWVTHDVIPSIRKTGSYSIKKDPNEQTSQLINNTQNLIEQTTALIEKIKQDQPYVDLGKTIEKAEGDITVRQMANIIEQAGFRCGETRLFEFLREKKYIFQIKCPNTNRLINQVYQRTIENGLMRIKESTFSKNIEKGNTEKLNVVYIQPLITTKGQLHILQAWKNQHSKQLDLI